MTETLEQFVKRFKDEYGYEFDYEKQFNPNKIIFKNNDKLKQMRKDCVKLLKQVAEENDLDYIIENHIDFVILFCVWEFKFGKYKKRTEFIFKNKDLTKCKWYGKM